MYKEIHFNHRNEPSFIFYLERSGMKCVVVRLHREYAYEIADFINRFRLTPLAADAAETGTAEQMELPAAPLKSNG